MPCPKGVSDSDCPGNGDPYSCELYDKDSKKCYYGYETAEVDKNNSESWRNVWVKILDQEEKNQANLQQLYSDLQCEYDLPWTEERPSQDKPPAWWALLV